MFLAVQFIRVHLDLLRAILGRNNAILGVAWRCGVTQI